MFFLRMIGKSISRQLKSRSLICLTVALAAAVSVAMLGIVYDVGDKLTTELSTYGSNITVRPRSDALVADLYGSSSANTPSSATTDPASFLKESDLQKIKTIFWAYNITNFAPQLNVHLTATNETSSQKADRIPVVGTWFSKDLKISTGEHTRAGLQGGMRSWWKVQGRWARDGSAEAMVGSALARELNLSLGDTVSLTPPARSTASRHPAKVTVVGIYQSHDDDDKALMTSSDLLQGLTGLADSVDFVEVKALTTPENDLARKAAKNPDALSQDEWETWYCTAYPSSIAYQIEEALPGSVAKQVRQVAALEGTVLQKTRAVMIVMTILTLVAAAIAVANLMSAALGQRASEFALLKALGAKNSEVARLILAETGQLAFLGAVVGSVVGLGLSQLVERLVFRANVAVRPMVFVLVAALLALTILLASASALRQTLRLQPAQVLHDR